MASANSGAAVVGGDGVYAPSQFVALVVDLISNLIRTGVDNPPLFYKLFLYLASGIDLAISNKEVPSRCSDIPLLLKEVQKCIKDSSFNSFKAAFMVLMISIKSACRADWFSNKDADDIELLTKEAVRGFSNPDDVDIGPYSALPYVKDILSRCNPEMKMEKIVMSLGVKAGFGAYVSDFNISKDTVTQHEKLCLFVALMDNARDIVTSPQINLMLNGKTVQEGIIFYRGIGAQLVADVTAMLEDGVNLLQAVGQFNGSYVIALATTRIIQSSENSELHDKQKQPVASVSSDLGSKIYKTSWQISLKCPMSGSRIKLPVKGSLCKHLECFDYETFMERNSKEPTWRCPICQLSVDRTSLKVDQRLSKVLREAPAHDNVIISKDGSWKPVPEKNLWTDISQIISQVPDKEPVLSAGLSTTSDNIKPNNISSDIRPAPVPSQHHSLNQDQNAVYPWVTQHQSTSPEMPKTNNVTPTQDSGVKKMRGSLTGQAYDDALSRFMSPPVQPAQATPRPTTVSPRHLPLVPPLHLPPPI